MRQAFVIFLKDARHLWPQTALALIITAGVGVLDRDVGANPFAGLVEILWLICWIYLGACLVHEEAIPGNDHFWLTRPYGRGSLLLAKTMFLAVFALMPVMIVQALALAANGVSPFRHLGTLLWAAGMFAGTAALISAALATVTENLVQLMWGLLALVLIKVVAAVVPASESGTWGTVQGIRSTALGLTIIAAAFSIVLVQYARRKTAVSRGIMIGAVLLTTPLTSTWHGAWTIQSAVNSMQEDSNSATLWFDRAGRPAVRYSNAPYFPGPGQEGLYLPVRIGALPDGAGIVSERVSTTIETNDGRRWNSGWVQTGRLTVSNSLNDVSLVRNSGPAWLYVTIGRQLYRSIADQPVRLEASVALVLLDHREAAPLRAPGRTMDLPQDGVCELNPGPSLPNSPGGMRNLIASCAWPGLAPAHASLHARSGVSPDSSEFALREGSTASLWIGDSVWQRRSALFAVRETGLQTELETWRAAAWLERKVRFPEVQLKDYIAPRATDPQ